MSAYRQAPLLRQWPGAVERDGLVDIPTGARIEKGADADAINHADD